MTTAARSPRRLAAVLAVLLVLLTGCAGLPLDDSVRRGLPVLGQPVQDVQVLPDGPAEGAAAGEIVAGFLRANVGFTDDHEVARMFLTDELARQWRPTEHVLIYEGDFAIDRVEEDLVEVTTTVRGRVEAGGYLTEVTRGTTATEEFELVRVQGQWRIAGFPEEFGVWLSEVDFERHYRSTAVHYVAPERDVLVPDVRWFPRGDGLPTALARALVQPVPAHLEGAVVSAVPPGSDLAAGAVPVDAATGVATVDLRGTGVAGEDDQRRRLYAQFLATLSQAPGVVGVQLQFGGQQLEVPDVGPAVTDLEQVGIGPAEADVPYALLRTGVELRAVNPYHYLLEDYRPGQEGPAVPELPAVPVRWVGLATDSELTELAAVAADRRSLWRWREGQEEVLPAIGTGLTTPSFDRLDGLFVGGRSAQGPQVWVVDTSDRLGSTVARPLEAPWLTEATQVVGLQVAPDDQRVALHLRDANGGDRLGLAGIVRDTEGRPVSLTEPATIAPTVRTVTDVEWLGPTTLAVLGRVGAATTDEPHLLQLGGWLRALSPVDEAVGVRGVPSAEDTALVVLNDRGRIYTQDGVTWSIARNGDDLVVPGN